MGRTSLHKYIASKSGEKKAGKTVKCGSLSVQWGSKAHAGPFRLLSSLCTGSPSSEAV